MRGKDPEMKDTKYSLRITPAHAGKSSAILTEESAVLDHPRTCGEKQKEKIQANSYKGSPPHMRGKVNSSNSC